MKGSISILSLLAVAITLGGAMSAAAQSNPVDCTTAKTDVAHLEHEKKSTDERKVKGVMSIMPIGIAINVMSSASGSSDKEMHIDEYNAQLERRIAEIKAACNL